MSNKTNLNPMRQVVRVTPLIVIPMPHMLLVDNFE